MKTEVTVTLVHTNPNQRFYQLSEKITIAPYKNKSIAEMIKEAKQKFKAGYKHLLADDLESWDVICISDSTQHLERLAFLGIKLDSGVYARMSVISIDGNYTMLTTGGSARSVKDDEVYLRHICSVNGFKFKGIV